MLIYALLHDDDGNMNWALCAATETRQQAEDVAHEVSAAGYSTRIEEARQ